MRFKPKILVVEDDGAMLRLLEHVLHELGAEPHLATSSPHAAGLVEREKFDGAFLDWRMPEMDGLELARRIRRSKSNGRIPLVMITGVASRSAVEESFRVGVNFFLQKPVSVTQLRHLLNASRGQMLEERRRYQRVPARLPMLLGWGGEQRKAESVNLSASGVLLNVEQPPPLGTQVGLEFELPDNPKPVKMRGVVARLPAAGGAAVQFHLAREEDRHALKEFVDRTLARLDVRGEGRPMPV